MMDNLKQKTIKGILWAIGELFGHHGIVLVITIFLAKILDPKDYGLAGIITAFFAIISTVIEGGFRQVLIRKREVSQVDLCTVFYFNLIVSLILYGLLYLCAPLIALFFKLPQLTPLVKVLGVTLIIQAFQIIQIVDLCRNMNFKVQTFITLPAGICAGGIAIVLAYNGFGVWSLVIQIIASNLITTILYWLLNSWRPTLVFSWPAFSELFSSSIKFLVSAVLDSLLKNLYSLIIGRYFAVHQLGYYSFSDKIQKMSSNKIVQAIQKVSYSTFSKIQDDRKRLLSGYKTVIQNTVAVIFPFMVFIIVMADPLFKMFLNEKWLPAIPYLRILCFVGAMFPLNSINLNIIQVKGKPTQFLWLKIIKFGSFLLMSLVLVHFGMLVLLLGQAVHSVFMFILISYFNKPILNYTLWQQIKDIMPITASSIIMGITLHSFQSISVFPQGVQLLVLSLLAMVVYSATCLLLRVSAFNSFYFMIGSRLNFNLNKK